MYSYMQFSGPASGVANAHNYKGPDKASEPDTSPSVATTAIARAAKGPRRIRWRDDEAGCALQRPSSWQL